MEPRLCARTAQRDGVRRRRQQSRPILKAPPAPRMARAASEIVEVEEARGGRGVSASYVVYAYGYFIVDDTIGDLYGRINQVGGEGRREYGNNKEGNDTRRRPRTIPGVRAPRAGEQLVPGDSCRARRAGGARGGRGEDQKEPQALGGYVWHSEVEHARECGRVEAQDDGVMEVTRKSVQCNGTGEGEGGKRSVRR